MKDFTFKIDKLTSKFSQMTSALKSAKDKAIKKILPDVIVKVKAVEKLADDVSKADSVVDDKTFDAKVKLLVELIDACNAAEGAIAVLSNKPVHDSNAARKGGDSVEVTEVPKGVKNPKIADLTDIGAKLTKLSSQVAATQRQAKSDLQGFTKWYQKVTKEGALEVDVPTAVTNMIETSQKNGSITMPKDMRFEARITYKGIPEFLVNEVPSLSSKMTTVMGKALAPLKQQTANNFSKWHKEFGTIKMNHNTAAASQLFKAINAYFDRELPGEIKKKVESAAMQALEASVSRLHQTALKNADVKATAVIDCNGFAIFEVDLPDKSPGEEVAKEYGETLKSLERSEKELSRAASSVTSSLDAFLRQKENAIEEMEILVEVLERLKPGFTKTDLEKTISAGARQRSKVKKALDDELKKFSDQLAKADKAQSAIKRALDQKEGKLKADVRTIGGQSALKPQLLDLQQAWSSGQKKANAATERIKKLKGAVTDADALATAFKESWPKAPLRKEDTPTALIAKVETKKTLAQQKAVSILTAGEGAEDDLDPVYLGEIRTKCEAFKG